VGSESPADLEPVEAWKHDVQYHEIHVLVEAFNRRETVGRHLDAEALSHEIALDNLGHGVVVLDDQYQWASFVQRTGARGPLLRSRRWLYHGVLTPV
jgi:hypothetical protein